MRVNCALLCDAVTTREGLLHILGGGITRLGRPAFPAPLGVALAVRLELDLDEAHHPHILKAILFAEETQQVGMAELEFGILPSALNKSGEPLAAALALPLHPVALPRPGRYAFNIHVDDFQYARVPFLVEQISAELEAPASGALSSQGNEVGPEGGV